MMSYVSQCSRLVLSKPDRVTDATSIALVPLLLMLAGCGAWHEERLEQATVAAIDDKLTTGMPFEEFRRKFPEATLIRGDDASGDWLVATQRICFICTSPDGFKRSSDTYARIVHFEQNRLKTVNPLPQGQGN